MNVIIAEDQEMFSLGLKAILNQVENIQIESIDSFLNGKEVLSKLNGMKPYNYLITDLSMPKIEGLELIEIVKTKFPKLKIIVVSMYHSHRLIDNLKSQPIAGFISKSINETEMINAFEKIFSGERVFLVDYEKTAILDQNESKLVSDYSIVDLFQKKYCLSSREQEISTLMISGLSSEEIAKKLFLSNETIKSYRKNIYLKTGVNNVLDLYKLLQNFKK